MQVQNIRSAYFNANIVTTIVNIDFCGHSVIIQYYNTFLYELGVNW